MRTSMNKIMVIVVIGILFSVSLTSSIFAAEEAKPTSSPVLVNGEVVEFEAYNINDFNYFKLRDLAMALNGTESSFEIDWNEEKQAITITTGQAYTAVGTELVLTENQEKAEVELSTSTIYLNDVEVSLTAYKIKGNNYFKLRDLGEKIGFVVDFDPETQTVIINSTEDVDDDKDVVSTEDVEYVITVLEDDKYYEDIIGLWHTSISIPEIEAPLGLWFEVYEDRTFDITLAEAETAEILEYGIGTIGGILDEETIIYHLMEDGLFAGYATILKEGDFTEEELKDLGLDAGYEKLLLLYDENGFLIGNMEFIAITQE